MFERLNPLFLVDHYKVTHMPQYPKDTQIIFSYGESRGGAFPETVYMGMQGFLKKYMTIKITKRHVREARELFTQYGGYFNYKGFIDMVNDHGGYWPVIIKSAKEGSIIPVKNCLFTIQVTDPKYFWVVSYLETILLRGIWYPTTVATLSYNCRKVLKDALEKSGTVESLDYRLHDFGARGVSSHESAMIGGMAHLAVFNGSDTVEATPYIRQYYADKDYVPAWAPNAASEHSSITSWGRDGEVDAYRNMIKTFGLPNAVVSIVSDSYDIYNACKIYGTELKEEIVNSGATIVARPDSGKPEEVVLQVIQELEKYFGTTVNSKGYKVLPDYIRVIQGDGITLDSLSAILDVLLENGYSADNVFFGMGGGLLQMVNRDTQKWAIKCSAALIGGTWIDVYKDPITDPGKQSKKGIITLVEFEDGTFETMRVDDFLKMETNGKIALEVVYNNGYIAANDHFETIRKRVRK